MNVDELQALTTIRENLRLSETNIWLHLRGQKQLDPDLLVYWLSEALELAQGLQATEGEAE